MPIFTGTTPEQKAKLEAAATLNKVATVAAAAIEVIGVLQAHLSYLSPKDRERVATDLSNRCLDLNLTLQQLGALARKEG